LDELLTDEEFNIAILNSKAASEDIRKRLNTVVVPVDKFRLPQVIKAITELFGDTYIDNNGNSSITYDMYLAVIKYLHTIGKVKGDEYV
jgi:hypothetical protein